MKRAILTAGLLFAALAASAKGADTILDKDPVGIYVTIVSVVTVLSALIVLFLLIQLFAKVMVKSAQKKAAKSTTRGMLVDDMKVSVPAGCDSVVNGEIIAAISAAVASVCGGNAVIRGIKRVSKPAAGSRRGAWGDAGVREHTTPFM